MRFIDLQPQTMPEPHGPVTFHMHAGQGWGLHVWADVRQETDWGSPLPLQGWVATLLACVGYVWC